MSAHTFTERERETPEHITRMCAEYVFLDKYIRAHNSNSPYKDIQYAEGEIRYPSHIAQRNQAFFYTSTLCMHVVYVICCIAGLRGPNPSSATAAHHTNTHSHRQKNQHAYWCSDPSRVRCKYCVPNRQPKRLARAVRTQTRGWDDDEMPFSLAGGCVFCYRASRRRCHRAII